MSIFTPDTSIQLSGNSGVSKTYNTKDNPNLAFHSRAGIYNSADNEIKFFTNNIDALTIDANQKVICNGSLITNLAWGNINGKPTNFQSDWNSTIINKPSLFDGTWTSLSGKPTNFQSDWLTTITNKPTLFDGTWTSLSGKPTLFSGNYNDLTNKTFMNNGNDIYNNNIGNVGIGITNPTSKLHLRGNLKHDLVYTTNLTSFGNLLANKQPWGLYFAEDWSGTTLPDSSGNGRDATTSGTITKTTASGNGASGAITYISGGTTATISFPTGSIPTAFTILALTRYNGGTRQRIVQSRTSGINWSLGHLSGLRGLAYFVNNYYTDGAGIAGIQDDWLTSIAKSSGTIPTNILMNGIQRGGGTPNTTGGYELAVNLGITAHVSDWALSCVMIWDSALTDAEMVLLNTTIDNYKSTGNSLIYELSKTFFLSEIYSTNNLYFNRELFKNNTNISNIFITSNVHSNSSNSLYNQIGNVSLTSYFDKNETSNIFPTSNVIKNSTNLINYNNLISKPTNFQSDWLSTIINIPDGLVNISNVFPTSNVIQNTQDLINYTKLAGKPTLFDGTWTSLSGKPTNFQSDWLTTITNKPSLFDGTWTSLSGKPSLFDGTWTSLSGKPTLFDGNYNSLTNKPFISSGIDIFTNNQGNTTIGNDTSITAVNGTISQVVNDNNSNFCVFLQSGSITFPQNTVCDIFMIGGGGGGGRTHAGGGGAGAYYYGTSQSLNSGTYTITIGAGGSGQTNFSDNGTNGGNTIISLNGTNLYLVNGGGRGGGSDGTAGSGTTSRSGKSGGCGGGGGSYNGGFTPTNTAIPAGSASNSGTNGTGNNGGTGCANQGGNVLSGGGGGGIGGNGGNAPNSSTGSGGTGGAGLTINITGTNVVYGGGGGGGVWGNANSITGGAGGGVGSTIVGGAGGTTGVGGNAIANTGSGGGGGGPFDGNGGNGSAGIVVIRYKIPNLIVKNNLIVNNNVGIGSTIPAYKLDVAGDVNITGNYKVNGNNLTTTQWTTSGTSIYYNNGNVGISSLTPAYKLDVAGDVNITGNYKVNGVNIPTSQWTTSGTNIYNNNTGNIGINVSAPNSYGKLQVNGVVNFHGGNPYAVPNNYMTAGSLTIGDRTYNYGNGYGLNTNVSGLLLECLDNTEIAVHDYAERVNSLINFVGGSTNNYHEYGRNMGWGHPNGHYFRCNQLFECYFANANSWQQYLSITPTTLWGDGQTTAADQGTGNKYLTMRQIMFQNPHVVPASVGGNALIRIGRAGGVQSGHFWDVATRTDGRFHIVRNGDVFSSSMVIKPNGNVSFANQNSYDDPSAPNSYQFLHLGNSATANVCDWNLCIHKSNGSGSTRHFAIGYDNSFYETIGDNGGNNTGSGNWLSHLSMSYNAPDYSLQLFTNGNFSVYGTISSGSDIKIKKNVRTIDNALWKVQQLRGVYYTHVIEETKNIGLIAQEVEGIIPEVVNYNERTDMKGVNYANLTALLINAIKEQQEIINTQNDRISKIEEILYNLINKE